MIPGVGVVYPTSRRGIIVGADAIAVLCLLDSRRTHHQTHPPPTPDQSTRTQRANFGSPISLMKSPIIFETIVLHFARVGPHINHPRSGYPAPCAVRERVGGKGDVRLERTFFRCGRNGEWRRVSGEEREVGVVRDGEYSCTIKLEFI